MKLNMSKVGLSCLNQGHMMVKGVAGSRKTTVAIRSISFLQNHFSHEEDDMITCVDCNCHEACNNVKNKKDPVCMGLKSIFVCSA